MIPVLVEIALIVIAYIVGWQWHSEVNAMVVKAVKWVGEKIKNLWDSIWKKK